jgi:tetratricopeptide (TPR) repeat protein
LGNQGKYDDAIKSLDKAIEINPQFVSAWYNKGDVLGFQGKYNESINAFDEVV